MKLKIAILVLSILAHGAAQAGFQCESEEVGLVVVAEHTSNPFGLSEEPALVKITTSTGDEIQMTSLVSAMQTRAGVSYSYALPVNDVWLSISEFSHWVSQPGCVPGGRATCDYQWSSTFKGYLTLNGVSNALDCQDL
tara:strand:+ start:5919 stop:6332 length:414 start_codon:yes stop_codon:yes gene_type:complete